MKPVVFRAWTTTFLTTVLVPPAVPMEVFFRDHTIDTPGSRIGCLLRCPFFIARPSLGGRPSLAQIRHRTSSQMLLNIARAMTLQSTTVPSTTIGVPLRPLCVCISWLTAFRAGRGANHIPRPSLQRSVSFKHFSNPSPTLPHNRTWSCRRLQRAHDPVQKCLPQRTC